MIEEGCLLTGFEKVGAANTAQRVANLWDVDDPRSISAPSPPGQQPFRLATDTGRVVIAMLEATAIK